MNRLLLMVLLTLSACSKEAGSINSFTERQHEQLMPYLYMFVTDAQENGVDLSYVFHNDNKIELKFANLEDKAGKAWAWNNKRKIKIWIDYDIWNRMDDQHKIELMYHEFGHDILKLDHNEKSKIMVQGSKRNIKPEELETEIKKLFK